MTYEQLQELYEIADGAWGDGAWMRGLAVAKIRENGHPYPTPSEDGETCVSQQETKT